jgi:hypothetical protein
MRVRLVLSAVGALLAAGLPVAGIAAQRGGGGGGGGGGMGGMDMMPNLPVQEDITGPVTFDSLKSVLSLEPEQLSALEDFRRAHIMHTEALRDSLAHAAAGLGYARATNPALDKFVNSDPGKLIKMYDKLLSRVRKADEDFYNKFVKGQLSKEQWKAFQRWRQGY